MLVVGEKKGQRRFYFCGCGRISNVNWCDSCNLDLRFSMSVDFVNSFHCCWCNRDWNSPRLDIKQDCLGCGYPVWSWKLKRDFCDAKRHLCGLIEKKNVVGANDEKKWKVSTMEISKAMDRVAMTL